jgi:riboflavin kinase/FMN adenylyltransferase
MGIHRLNWDETPPEGCSRGAVTVGNFDGVHRGHADLVAEVQRQARAVQGPAVAVTFDPHPLKLLRPEQFQPVLTTATDRAALLEACGADHVVLLQTTPALLHLTAGEFFHRVLQSGLGSRAIVEGRNFGFGRDREGDIDTLARLCGETGIHLEIVPPVLYQGKSVSSSRVRNALLEGAVRQATELLSRPYRVHGTVATGQRRGRTIGFPTANLEQIETLVPGDGVYAVRVKQGTKRWPGAANIGPNPTFGENVRKIEAHLIGFEGDIYGRPLALDFIARLRDLQKFAGPEALVRQLRQDVAEAKRLDTERAEP